MKEGAFRAQEFGYEFRALRDAPSRWEERALSPLGHEAIGDLAQSAKDPARARRLKEGLFWLERSILSGDTQKLEAVFKENPWAALLADHSLREYESDNLLCYALKWAPAGKEIECAKILMRHGASFPAPAFGGFLRSMEGLDVLPAHASAKSKTLMDVALFAEELGWKFGMEDVMSALRESRSESSALSRDAPPDEDDERHAKAWAEKLRFVQWVAQKGNVDFSTEENHQKAQSAFCAEGAPWREDEKFLELGRFLGENGADLPRLIESAGALGFERTRAMFTIAFNERELRMASGNPEIQTASKPRI